jgi:hypothetical protein
MNSHPVPPPAGVQVRCCAEGAARTWRGHGEPRRPRQERWIHPAVGAGGASRARVHARASAPCDLVMSHEWANGREGLSRLSRTTSCQPTFREIRPGRSSAGSSTSIRLVAARKSTPERVPQHVPTSGDEWASATRPTSASHCLASEGLEASRQPSCTAVQLCGPLVHSCTAAMQSCAGAARDSTILRIVAHITSRTGASAPGRPSKPSSSVSSCAGWRRHGLEHAPTRTRRHAGSHTQTAPHVAVSYTPG